VKTWHRSVSGDTAVTTYDALFPTRVRTPGGSLYKTTVNALGWPTTSYGAVDTTQSISSRYDLGGRLTSWTNRRGQRVDIVYDSLNRIIRQSGTNIPTDTFTYASNGLIQTMQRGTISLDSTFLNVAGQPDSIVHHIGGHRYAFLYTFAAYSYGQRASETITTDAGITFVTQSDAWRPAATTLDSIVVSPGTASGSVVWTTNNGGDLTQTHFPVGTAKNMSYTVGHLLTGASLGSAGTAVHDSLSRNYALDSLGRVAVEWRQSGTDSVPRVFFYDGFGRLLKVQSANASGCTSTTDSITGAQLSCSTVTQLPTKDSVGYDVAGNRTLTGSSYSTTGNQLLTWPASSGTVTYTYDADGNMVTRTHGGVTDSLFWGATDMLDSVHSGGFRRRYEYNSAGLPVRRSTNGNVDRLWLWNGGQLIADLDSTGTHRKVQYLYHGGTDQVYAIATDSGGSPLVRYVQQDGLGNVTGITRGNTLQQFIRYTAWGQVEAAPINTLADTNRLGWKGLMYEPDSTQLYFVRNRWYDPQAGRFVSEDPIGIAGGSNVYTFAGDDPINGQDPIGEAYYQDQCHKVFYGLISYCSLIQLASPIAGSYFGCHIAMAGTPIGDMGYYHCALSAYTSFGQFSQQWELLTKGCVTSWDFLCNNIVPETQKPSDEATFNWVYLTGVSSQNITTQAKYLLDFWQGKPYALPTWAPYGSLGNSNTYACTLLDGLGYTLSYADAISIHLLQAPLENCNIEPFTRLYTPGSQLPLSLPDVPGSIYSWFK